MNKDKVSSKKRLRIGFYFEKLRRQKAGNIIIVFTSIQILAIIISLIAPSHFRYLDNANLQVMFKAIPQIGIIALGVNLLMIAGEFDLSIGAIFTFSALIMAKSFNAGIPIFISALISLIVGVLIGLTNGLLVVKSKVPSFIITLGSMYFWRGMILVVSQAQNERFDASSLFKYVFAGNIIGPIQLQFIWMILVAVVTWVILERSKLGNHFFSVGGNRNAAKALGINVNRVKVIAFMIAGLLAALSGLVSTARVTMVSPIQGEGLELQAIAACVIGGTALMGGGGSVIGAFLGAALLYTIQDFLLLAQAPGFYFKLFIGAIIIFSVILNQVVRKEE